MDYSTVYGEAWDSETAKGCRGDAVLLAMFAYLMTTRHANMIGVFSLPWLYIQHDLGLSKEEIERALDHFEHDGFIVRDANLIFVRRMAEVRMSLANRDTPLSKQDNRLKKAHHLYNALQSPKLADAFFDQYQRVLSLKRRDFKTRQNLDPPPSPRAAVTADPPPAPPPAVRSSAHRAHAWCSTVRPLCVPMFLHEEFLGVYGASVEEPALFAKYEQWVAALGPTEPLPQGPLAFFRKHVTQDMGRRRPRTRTELMDEAPARWLDLLAYLESRLPRHAFYTWIRPLRCVSAEGDKLLIAADDARVQFVLKHYGKELDEATKAVSATIAFQDLPTEAPS